MPGSVVPLTIDLTDGALVLLLGEPGSAGTAGPGTSPTAASDPVSWTVGAWLRWLTSARAGSVQLALPARTGPDAGAAATDAGWRWGASVLALVRLLEAVRIGAVPVRTTLSHSAAGPMVDSGTADLQEATEHLCAWLFGLFEGYGVGFEYSTVDPHGHDQPDQSSSTTT